MRSRTAIVWAHRLEGCRCVVWSTPPWHTSTAISPIPTTTRTPDQLHQLGLDVIAGLRAEYAELGSRVFGTSDQSEIFHRLATDPAMRWRNAEEVLATARAAMDRAEAEMPKWFGILPGQ